MADEQKSKRGALIRNSIVFQLKLMADGFRDLVLLPVSLIATLIGLLRGGDEPEREFLQVINLGRESEKWIDLFGHHDLPGDAGAAASMDALFDRIEATLKQQYLAAGISQDARDEIDEALHTVQEQTKEGRPDQ